MREEAASLERVIKGSLREVRGTVNLSMPPALGAALIAPALASLGKHYPALSVTFHAETQQASLQK